MAILIKEVPTVRKPGVLLKVRLTSKTYYPLNPYTAWDYLKEALKDNPNIEVEEAEIRVAKDSQTSIEE